MSGYPGYGGSPAHTTSGYPVPSTAYSQYPTLASPSGAVPAPVQNILGMGRSPYGASSPSVIPTPIAHNYSPTSAALNHAPAAATTAAPSSTTNLTTAAAGQDISFEDGVELEKMEERTIYDFDHYDSRQNAQIRCMSEARSEMQSLKASALSVLTLFNSIVTIMMLLTAFKRNTESTVVESFGHNWIPLTNFIIYAPIGFFLLIFYVINNFSSERVFYESLRRGILVDYPNSSELGYIFKHAQPIIFIVLFFAYFFICIVVMLIARASLGSIVAYSTNMLVGVALWWFSQQSIESRFVSLSDFIMVFPQKDRRYASLEDRAKERDSAKMDAWNLKCTTYFLRKLVLNEAKEPSYSAKMRVYNWKQKNYSTCRELILHFGTLLLLGVCVGGCVVYFFLLGESDIKQAWASQLNPCTSVCANVSSSLAGANFGVSSCDACLCQCTRDFHKNTVDYLKECEANFVMPSQCAKIVTVKDMCKALNSCGSFIKV